MNNQLLEGDDRPMRLRFPVFIALAGRLASAITGAAFNPVRFAACAATMLACGLASIANATLGGEPSALDRSRFGESLVPVWSELTTFEEKTILQADLLHSANPDALLAFYLLASGDVREQSQFESYQSQIQRWLQSSKLIAGIPDEKIRGQALHSAMHAWFIADGANMRHYDLNQSKLSTLLDTQVYNCISSALLYAVLARYMGLQPEGVILPSHAYVQIRLNTGKVVEVETTSRDGYNQEHNEDFYDPQSGNWFADRELSVPTYADYLKRDIVSPFQLGLENMWSQHTHSERMDYQDRMRLAEIRAHLEPQNVDAQKNRLFFYTREFSALNRAGDYDTLAAMYDQIAPYLEQLASLDAPDQELANLLAWVKSGMAVAYVNSAVPEKGLQLARQQLGNFDDSVADASDIRSNLLFVLADYVEQQTKAGRFSYARGVLEGQESHCLANAACEQSFANLHAQWAQHHWKRRDWPAAIDLYRTYLQLNGRGKAVRVFRSNLESAYLNWANGALYDEDWQTALGRLKACVDQLPESTRCRQQQRSIREKRHMGVL